MIKNFLFYFCTFAVCQLGLSYKGGAPTSACHDMVPQHGVPSKPFPSPYTLKLDKKHVKAGEKIKLTISSPTDTFKGFFIKAVENSTNATYGTFEAAPGTKFVDCDGKQKSAITHIDDSDKSIMTITWIAPRSGKKTMNFLATVAKDGGEFWVGQKSERFTVG